MSASHRSLARLPLSVFEGLVEEANDGSSLGREDVDSRENATAKEAQEEQEAQRQDAAIQLRMQLCDKLQHVKLASSSSHPSWFLVEEGPLWNMNASGTVKIKTVGDFFWLPLWTLVKTLDPLLTYGAYNTVSIGYILSSVVFSFSHDWFLIIHAVQWNVKNCNDELQPFVPPKPPTPLPPPPLRPVRLPGIFGKTNNHRIGNPPRSALLCFLELEPACRLD